MFFSFLSLPPVATFNGVHRISFLFALALFPRRIQYVLCAYARKFKYLLFVIKFGRVSRMGILHRDCAMQRDGSSLSIRGNCDLHIDRYFILLSHFVFVPVYRSILLFIFHFRSVMELMKVLVSVSYYERPSSPFHSYPYSSTRFVHLP